MGQKINRLLEAVDIPINIANLTVALELAELKIPKLMHRFVKFGSSELADISNSVVAPARIYYRIVGREMKETKSSLFNFRISILIAAQCNKFYMRDL
jgi:hypothetical protein